MADQFPSSQPSAVTPPAPPVSPVDESEELAKLSPFEVMKHRQLPTVPTPVTPVAPPAITITQRPPAAPVPVAAAPSVPASPFAASAPVQLPVQPVAPLPAPIVPPPVAPIQPVAPVAPAMSREQLLRQAAEAPTNSFILPNSPAPVAQVPAPVSAAAVSAPVLAPPPPAPRPVTPPPAPAFSIAKAPVAPPPRPVTPPPAPPPPAPRPVTPPPAPASIPSVRPAATVYPRPKAQRSMAAAAIGGSLLVLILLGGTAYALAASGTRVPFLYSYLSGLNTDGLKAGSQANVALAAQSSYEQTGEVSIKSSGTADGTSKPSLPTSIDASSATTISSLTTTQSLARFDNVAKNWEVNEKLSVDLGTDVPVALKGSTSEASTSWTAYLAANTATKLVSVDSTSLKSSLLYPALTPNVASTVLGALTKATSYQKKSQGSQNVASYQYVLDGTKLAAILPEGATVAGATAEAEYLWKSRLPSGLTLNMTFKYLGITYQYQGAWKYANWNAPISSTTASDFQPLSGSTSSPITRDQFISQLGIKTGALPMSAAAATVTAITPTGQSVTVIGNAITATPPLPTSVATADMLSRDVQRKKDLSDLQSTLEAYKTKVGTYPAIKDMVQTQASADLLAALVPTYLTAMPVDPLPDTYWYEYSSDGSSYLLRSVAENATDAEAKKGVAYYYFERTNK